MAVSPKLNRTPRRVWHPLLTPFTRELELELELELIQTQMAQKPILRAEVYAHAMRASHNRKKDGTLSVSY